MGWVDAFERVSDEFHWFFAALPISPWLFLIPLFWTIPSPGEPERYDGCTYREDCLEELKSFRELVFHDKKQNKEAPAQK